MSNNSEEIEPTSSPAPRKKMRKETKIVLWLLGLGAMITVSLVVGVILLMQDDNEMLNEDPRWLYVDLRLPFTSSPQPAGLLDDPSNVIPLTTEMADLIRRAGTDDQILGIRAELGGLGLGWAQVEELRQAFIDYRESGKECKVWAEAYTNKEYYLASACNEVLAPEAGVFLVTGLGMTITYYADLFEELDIKPNFAHVGDFKSAVEPYERTGPSESASEATNALLDSLYDAFITGIAEGRQLSSEKVRALLDAPPITPQGALNAGAIDNIEYRDQFLMKDNEDFEFFHWRDFWNKLNMEDLMAEKSIAIIYADGAIMNGSSGNSLFGGQSIGDHTMRRHIQNAIDAEVDALVLRISSPGGSGSASDAIWRELQRVKSLGIPVVISMGDYAASGGYYISMIGDYIYAQPNTITGSIGVFGGKLNFAGLYNKLGMNLHTYQRGEFANLFSSTSDFSEAERAKYQEFLDGFYTVFITKAAEGRNLTVEQIHEVAQGRVWTGTQALEHKLIDELGGLDDAINKAAELANITNYDIITIPQPKSVIEEFLEELGGGHEASLQMSNPLIESLPTPVHKTLQQAELIHSMLENDPRISMVPMVIDIE